MHAWRSGREGRARFMTSLVAAAIAGGHLVGAAAAQTVPDCNGNGVDDAEDIQQGTSLDCNGNGTPDECDLVPTGLGYWRFEEFSYPVLDWGPYGILQGSTTNGVRSADVPVDPVPLNGLTNERSMNLGGNGYIVIAEREGLLTMTGVPFTIEAWIRVDALSDGTPGSRQWLCQKKLANTPDNRLNYAVLVQGEMYSATSLYGKTTDLTGRELMFVFGDGEETVGITSSLMIEQTGWHFVSVAIEPTDGIIRFGLDGQFETVFYEARSLNANTGPLVIGAHTSGLGEPNQHLRGAVDEFRLSRGYLDTTRLLDLAAGADCNGNGIPDDCDIESGTSIDCNGDFIPDECQLAGNDCNGNGVPDECDMDCNGNGIPDECDIASGHSADCQPDGVPDECQLESTASLFYDIGFGEIAVRTDVPFMAWMNRFNVAGDAGVVETIDFMVTLIPLGTPLGVYVWSDPNGDGDPSDAQVLWSEMTTIQESGVMTRMDVPDIDVGETGASFFVGFTIEVTDQDFPAVLDISGEPEPGRSWQIGWTSPIDVNDLSAEAVEYGTIDEILFAGNWVIRANMRGPGTDCNGNGAPDDCDIADGISVDEDANGIPDACEDCNGNGVVDGFDIAGGTSMDCNADGVPDECQLASNDCNGDGIPDGCQLEYEDCNGNGILDSCDIASGYSEDADGSGAPDECEDCNGNGFPDSIDILDGVSTDCNGDLVPDECQFGDPGAPLNYAYDDGTKESNLNYLGEVEVAWMNRFIVQPGGEWISAIQVVWGNTYPGLPAKVVLWSDPNGDGHPADAQVLAMNNTMSANVQSNVYNTTPIPATYVGPAGTSFFVGVYVNDVYLMATAPPALDMTSPNFESWAALALPGEMDLNDLGAYALDYWPTWDFMVRAVGGDGVFAFNCNGNGRLDVCDIEDGSSVDADGNGVPDECECLGDLDASGAVDETDLLALLDAWGPCPGCAADLTEDGVVNANDLFRLLGAWGDCQD